MKINNISQKIAFKSVYRGNNDSETQQLNQLINPNNDRKISCLVKPGQVVGFKSNKPILILTNDEFEEDAKQYLDFREKSIEELHKWDPFHGTNTIEELEAELTDSEIKANKNPSSQEIKNFPERTYKDRLAGAIIDKLREKVKAEDINLYESFNKKVKVFKPEDIKEFQAGILNYFKRFAKKI